MSGDNQQGPAWEPLAEPFVVRVTDEQGQPARDRSIEFEIISGRGYLTTEAIPAEGALIDCSSEGPFGYARTDANGLARITFVPKDLGRA